MAERDGSIITLSYEAAQRAYPGYSVMGVAKAALENAVKQLAAEVGPKGVRVNAVSPGPVDTLSARSIRGFARMKQYHRQVSPLRRNTTQSDIAGSALFLASELSRGITGATIPVDSGFGIVGVPYEMSD
jgi:enoyl-[acyl-carrier protein] reductase I